MIQPRYISRYRDGNREETPDAVAVEEPLEIRLGFGAEDDRQQKSLSVTMRTPGNDEELATGFLITEGIIQSFTDLLSVKHCCEVGKEEQENIIRAELQPNIQLNWNKLDRHFYTTSSCGVCGKSSIEAVTDSCKTRVVSDLTIDAQTILSLPQKLNEAQLAFKYTGGIHASALFDQQSNMQLVREDVGRHNALDKLIGACVIKNELPLSNHVLLLSGRISFELVQKSAQAGIPIIAAIGAPSSLAVDLANEMNITLVGFLKQEKFNIYTHQERIVI